MISKTLLSGLFRNASRQITFRHHSTTSKSDSECIRNLCQTIGRSVLLPRSADLDKLGRYPADMLDLLAEKGLMGITASKDRGGCGLNVLAVSVAVEELSRYCASTGALVSIHNLLYIDFLETYGNQLQKQNFIRPYVLGTPGAFALSESDAGSDVANLSTSWKVENDTIVINGTKAWVTSGSEAEMAIVFATSDKNNAHKSISAFLVPLKEEGVTKGRREDKMGIRATSTCSLTFDNVRIPTINLVGEYGQGFSMAMQQLSKARIGIASQAVGIAQGCLDLAVKYAESRIAFGKKIINFQGVQFRLAKMATKIEASRLLVQKAAEKCDAGENFTKYSSMAKLIAAEAANFCATECVQILGGMGYVGDLPAERYFRDAKITDLYGGVTDIQLLIVANQLFKEYGIDV